MMCDPVGDGSLELSVSGVASRPLVLLELDDLAAASPGEIARVAEVVAQALPLVVGVLRTAPTAQLYPVLAAATLTVTDVPGTDLRQVVAVDDVDAALDQLGAAVARAPQAALACGQLLRQTGRLLTTQALAAEASVYSMLLGGSEFARWLAERGPARDRPAPARDLVQLHRGPTSLSIVLDHPQRRNALSARLREELLAAMQLAEADPSIETIELSGAGPTFCSGGDLDEFGTATDLVAAYLVRLDRAPWRIMDRLADRLVVRAHGPCIGAGAEMTAFAKTVVAAPDMYFQFPEVHMGLVPGAGGTVSVPRRIGRWRAAWLMLTGARLFVETARQWGLVDRLAGEGR